MEIKVGRMAFDRRTTGITEHEVLTQRKSKTDDRVLRVHAIVPRYSMPRTHSVPFYSQVVQLRK